MLGRYLRVFELRLGGRRRIGDEMDREIDAHLEMRVADLMRRGMSETEARDEARRRFGDFERARRRLRAGARRREAAMRHRDWFGAVIADVRFAFRQARRTPTFTLLAIASLSLGIGATTTMFTLVDRALLRPLPFPAPERLVTLNGSDSAHSIIEEVSSADWLDWRTATSLQASAIYSFPLRQTIVTADSATRVSAVRTSGDFFRVLESRFVIGRPFSANEAENRAPVVVISSRLWQRMFGADPRLATPLRTPVRSYTIVGVVPDNEVFPAGTDVWFPVPITRYTDPARVNVNWLAIARLTPGVTPERATLELSSIARGIRASDPTALYDFAVTLKSLGETISGDAAEYLRLLMAAVSFVLLIVCANLAASSLARGSARAREMAVRTSLGAGRRRLVQQLLIEHLVLGLAGGAIGLAIAWGAVRIVVAHWSSQLPRAGEIALDGRVFTFAVGVSLAAGVVVGILPALRITRVALHSTLAAGGRGTARGGRNLAGASLVSLEIGLALLLLTGAGLLIRSFRTVLARDLGFDANVATVGVTLTGDRYARDTVRRYVYWNALIESYRRIPGVEAASVASWIPLGLTGRTFVDIRGREGQDTEGAVYRAVSPDFFRTLRIPLAVGRAFGPEDGTASERVVVVNRTMAERDWPGRSPIGEYIRARGMESGPRGQPAPWLRVVGVVGDVRAFGLESDARPEMYVDFRQRPAVTTEMTALVRAAIPASRLGDELRRRAREIDPSLAVDVSTLESRLRNTLAARRFTMSLLAGFAGTALVLAALGIYGVLSYAVTLRTRELAVRAALGAQPRDLLQLVFVAGLRVVAVGLLVGVVAAVALSRLIVSVLVGVTPGDPLTFAGSVATLTGVALLAILVPARRAVRLEPIIALQAD